MKRRVMVAGLAAAAVAGNCALAQTGSDLPDASTVLDSLPFSTPPHLRFTDAGGRALSLGDYRGHGIVLNVWATWCGPCVDELPSLVRLAPKLLPAGILVLPVSIDVQGAAVVAPFYANHGITGVPLLLDPDGTVMDRLEGEGIPITVIINPAGKMVARLDGAADWDTAGSIAMITQLAGMPADGKDGGFVPA
jgi:thiol-disulfide isomerase/thioredoxin